MSSKILLQFFLLSVLIIISTIFYFKYVHKSNFELKIEENNQIVKEGENKIKKNLVEFLFQLLIIIRRIGEK